MTAPEKSDVALPPGMVSAEEFIANENTMSLACASAEESDEERRKLVAHRDAQWRKALDEARDESAALKESYDRARIALAASQAECAELREALDVTYKTLFMRCGGVPPATDEERRVLDFAGYYGGLLSRPTGTQDALRAVIKDTISECAMTMRSRCGCTHCDEMMPGWSSDEIAARVLGEAGND